jgi:hypothetical protein
MHVEPTIGRPAAPSLVRIALPPPPDTSMEWSCTPALRLLRRMPARAEAFMRFWDINAEAFADVSVCPMDLYRRNGGGVLALSAIWGLYDEHSGTIYLRHPPAFSPEVLFHELSHHVLYLHMPSLYSTARGRAVEELVADIAARAAVRRIPVPPGTGWRLVRMGMMLKRCRAERKRGRLSPLCPLWRYKAKPSLLLKIPVF